ncbi:hypothetical protein [Pseudooceanicola nanhaiensis]|uniref:hypothetical protein n=1 Tax=Pseudooceanicola nanhaiensis TaxID=375761 RepID=UPI0035171A88
MSVTGRTLSSVSQSPATGLHSAALVPGLGANAQFTLFLAFKDPGGNSNNTVWADDNGGCQVWINSSNGRLYARYAGSSSGPYIQYTVGQWCFAAIRMGLDISGGVNDVVMEGYDAVLGYEAGEANTSGGGGPRIETTSRHYAMGDDAGTAFTDDGTEVKVFGLALLDGLWTLDQLGCDTATGQAKAFDAAAEASLIYALRGMTSVGNDDSGNGNHFTVENVGVVFDEADLPPGVSLPSSGASLTAAGVSAVAEIGATALGQTHVLEGEGLAAASEVGAAVLAQTHSLTAAGLVVVAGAGAAELSVRHALTPAGFDASVELGAPTLSQGQATVPQGVEVAAEVGSPAIVQSHALAAAGLEGVAELGLGGITQVHALAPIGLPIASEIGPATLTQDHNVAATGVEVPTQVGSPVAASFSGLLGVGVQIAAAVGAPALVQRHSLTPAVPGVSAEVGAAVLTQVHSLSAFSIVTASEIGAPVVRDASLPSLVVIEISGAPAAGLSVAGRPAPPVVSVGGPNDIAFIIGGL